MTLASRLADAKLFRTQAYVNGAWCDSDDRQVVEIRNPGDGSVIGAVPMMGRAETCRAIDAAQAAFGDWKARTAKERSMILRRWYDLMIANIEDLALIITAEQGKPLSESRAEIQYAAGFMEWFSEEAKRIYGDLIPSPASTKRIIVMKQPVGVCAAITPWNFPSAMITRKVAPALAAGCTMVLKPAPQTPFSALALCELAERAGVPKGVFSCVLGHEVEIGEEMTGNKVVRKFTFTGSTAVGEVLNEKCARTLKRVSLELGGNAPLIIFDDADLDTAIQGTMTSKFRNGGQSCIASNRLLVQRGIYDRFADRLRKAVEGVKVGSGLDKDVTVGPMINERAVKKIEELLAQAVQKGARVVLGGKRHALGGNFFEPTIICDVTPDMRIVTEEIFGPIVPLLSFANEQDAVAMANATDFGLAAYFHARDINRISRVSETLEYGIVGVNEGLISTEVAPFGGIKESGLGREGSKYGIEEFIEKKYVCIGGISPVA